MAPVMIANPLLVEENIHLAEAKQPTAAGILNDATNTGPPTEKSPDNKPYYLVKPGDNLSTVAASLAKDPKLLAEWNRLSPPYQINAGQKLMLSAPEQASGNIPAKMDTIGKTPVTNAQKTAVKNGTDKQPAKTAIAAQNSNTPIPVAKANPTTDKPQTAQPSIPNEKATNPIKKSLPPDKNKAKPPATGSQKNPAVSIENKKMLKLAFQWPVNGTISKDFPQSHGKGIDISPQADKQSVNAAESGKVVYQGQGLSGFNNLIIIKHNGDYLTAYANNSRLLVKEGQEVSKGQAIAEIGAIGKGNKHKALHFEIRKNGDPVNPVDYLPK